MNALEQFHAEMKQQAGVKRFFERWTSDPEFRSQLRADPSRVSDCKDTGVTPEQVAELVALGGGADAFTRWRPMQAIWRVATAKARWVHHFYQAEATPKDPRMRRWAARQRKRQVHDLGPFHAATNLHASVCFELTLGCSVGCWFCALSPGRLTGVLEGTKENRALFGEVLDALDARLGRALASGFLYWATDPLDNPDYEVFCEDFHARVGVFPPTTTALHLADVERTRRLLTLAEQRGCWLNRFSVLSRKLMERTHETFSANELALVECMPLNSDAAFAYGNAGRFRERAQKRPEILERERKKLSLAPWHKADERYAQSDEYANGSIGCVTGFLINMVKRSIQLISPCTASDRWPLGYIVFDEAQWEDGRALAAILERMMNEHMGSEVLPEQRISLAEPLRVEPLADGFSLLGRFGTSEAIRSAEHGETLARLGQMLSGGPVEGRALFASGPEAVVRSALDDMLARGLLAEEIMHER